MIRRTGRGNFIAPWLVGCLCSLLTFVVAIALAVLAGITFESGTIVKLLPTLALALSVLAFVLGYRKQRKSRLNPEFGM